MNESLIIDDVLVRKYNLPVPRYTSYPTVPYWHQQIDANDWQENVKQQFAIHNSTKESVSIFICLSASPFVPIVVVIRRSRPIIK